MIRMTSMVNLSVRYHHFSVKANLENADHILIFAAAAWSNKSD